MTTAPCFPPTPILAHWHTLAHRAMCQGEPVCQLSALATRLPPSLGSGANRLAAPVRFESAGRHAQRLARSLTAPPWHTLAHWHTGTRWHTCANRRCARIRKLKSPESSFAQVSSTNGGGRLEAGTLAHLYLFFLQKRRRRASTPSERHTPSVTSWRRHGRRCNKVGDF